MRYDELSSPIPSRGPIRRAASQVTVDNESLNALPLTVDDESLDVFPITLDDAGRTAGVDLPPVAERWEPGLASLVSSLREQVGGFPLAVAIYGWDRERSSLFLSQISRWLQSGDAVWLIADPNRAVGTASLQPGDCVELDLHRDKDERIHRNLVCDITFYPAALDPPVNAWLQRTRAVIVDGSGAGCDAVLERGCSARLNVYRWDGHNGLEAYLPEPDEEAGTMLQDLPSDRDSGE